MTKFYFQQRQIPIPVVNPDDVAKDHPHLGNLNAGKIAIELQRKYLRDRQSFIFETTLSGGTALTLMRTARAEGYKVNLIYICLGNSQANVFRVMGRVAAGGHDVPEEDIRRRYVRSLENLYEAIMIADRSFILDNSLETPRLLLARSDGKNRNPSKKMPAWFIPVAQRLGVASAN